MRFLVTVFLVLLVVISGQARKKQTWHYEGHHLAIRDDVSVALASDTFGYEGAIGPEFWSTLDPGWATCGSGTSQSPVSLNSSSVSNNNSQKLSFNYSDLGVPVSLQNNGHTLFIDVATNSKGNSSYLTFNGNKYSLLQFHFHQNSEHHVDRLSHPIEMHLVHQNSAGDVLVVGVFYDRVNTEHGNKFLRQFWNLMPTTESIVLHNIRIKWQQLFLYLNTDSYWAYSGSLTTPPCTEGVQWVVIQNPIPISFEQWQLFDSINGFCARFTQPLNNRTI